MKLNNIYNLLYEGFVWVNQKFDPNKKDGDQSVVEDNGLSVRKTANAKETKLACAALIPFTTAWDALECHGCCFLCFCLHPCLR